MNLEPSLGSYLFNESRTGPAGEMVPEWVDELLSSPLLQGGD
jgi:NAD-dependent deacetylase